MNNQIIGIDEVGRGSWAGPLLVVAARQKSNLPAELTDSKDLSKSKRQHFIETIVEACDLGEGWVQPEEIDEIGLAESMKLGVSRALLQISAGFDETIIIDGNINYCPPDFVNARAVIKADSLYSSVSAASVYAKVTRDNHMVRIAPFHPFYGFEQHVGYGTALHMSALKIHGACSIHRKSYKPIQAYL